MFFFTQLSFRGSWNYLEKGSKVPEGATSGFDGELTTSADSETGYKQSSIYRYIYAIQLSLG